MCDSTPFLYNCCLCTCTLWPLATLAGCLPLPSLHGLSHLFLRVPAPPVACAVPERWRQSFREGVEGWVPAFSAAGFGEKAIRAVLPGDPDWPKDYAAGDIR